jgi:hypothetical protein
MLKNTVTIVLEAGIVGIAFVETLSADTHHLLL